MVPIALDAETFLSLSGQQLWEYVARWSQSGEPKPDAQFFDRALGAIDGLDMDHLVYLLPIGATHNPEVFVNVIPRFLAHPDGAVWSAASRSLGLLPTISRSLIEDVKRYAAQASVDLSREIMNLESRCK